VISKNNTKSGKLKTLYGSENVVERGVRFMQNTIIKMDITFDHKAPSIVVQLPDYCNGYEDI
jgi:two-component system, OmpR family, sensor histidine kinase VicK